MKRLLVLVVIIVAILAGAFAYVRAHGFSAREKPNRVEAAIAVRLRSLAVPAAARGLKNPAALTPEVLSESMAHFADHCAICHANNGNGDTAIGKGLYPKPPDMRAAATQNMTDGELYYIIHNGVRFTGMPAFGDAASNTEDMDSWKLVHFIRRLPMLTAEEIERMKGMNPKSPADIQEEEDLERFLKGEDTAAPEPGHKHH